MTDYSELKRLATLAVNEPGQLDMAFVAAASPSVILAILAELDALRDENKRFRSVVKEVLVQLGGQEHDT